MESLYKLLKKHKTDKTIMFEIVGSEDKEARLSRTINIINNFNISNDKKTFLIKQLSFDCGKFSYEDLYILVDYYITKLPKINNPYENVFPIYIDDRTYLNNIALFIACLELGYNPALVDESSVELIEENKFNQNNVFYICSSGSVKRKFVPLRENELIKKHKFINISGLEKSKGKIFYNITSMSAISGLVASVIFPLLKNMKVVMNNKNELFNNIAKYKANYVLLPLNYNEYLRDIYNVGIEDFSHLEQIIIGGDYYSKHDFNNLLLNNIISSKNNITYLYGQTETYLYGSSIKIGKSQKVKLNIFDILLSTPYQDYLGYEKCQSILKNIKENIKEYYKYKNSFEIEFYSIGKKNKFIKVDGNPYGEILVNGLKTNDIGYIDKNGYIYMIGRKDSPLKLLQNLLNYQLDIKSLITQEKTFSGEYCFKVGVDTKYNYNRLELSLKIYYYDKFWKFIGKILNTSNATMFWGANGIKRSILLGKVLKKDEEAVYLNDIIKTYSNYIALIEMNLDILKRIVDNEIDFKNLDDKKKYVLYSCLSINRIINNLDKYFNMMNESNKAKFYKIFNYLSKKVEFDQLEYEIIKLDGSYNEKDTIINTYKDFLNKILNKEMILEKECFSKNNYMENLIIEQEIDNIIMSIYFDVDRIIEYFSSKGIDILKEASDYNPGEEIIKKRGK